MVDIFKLHSADDYGNYLLVNEKKKQFMIEFSKFGEQKVDDTLLVEATRLRHQGFTDFWDSRQ